MGKKRLRSNERFVFKREIKEIAKRLIELQKMGFEVCILAVHNTDINNTILEGTEIGKLFLQTNNVHNSFATFLKGHKNVTSDITEQEHLGESRQEKTAAKLNNKHEIRAKELETRRTDAYDSETDIDEKFSDNVANCNANEVYHEVSENMINEIDEDVEDKNDIVDETAEDNNDIAEEEDESMENKVTYQHKTKAKQPLDFRLIDFLREDLNLESTIKDVSGEVKATTAPFNNYASKVVKLYDSYRTKIDLGFELVDDKACPFCDIPNPITYSLQEHTRRREHIKRHLRVLESKCIGRCNKCHVTLPSEYLRIHPCPKKEKLQNEMKKCFIDFRDFIAWMEMSLKFCRSSDSTITCHECKEKIDNSNYSFHFFNSHGVVYQCSCGEMFKNDAEIETHLKPVKCGVKDESMKRCKDCKIMFNTMDEVKDHLLAIHRMTGEYACEKCGLCYRCLSGLSGHRCLKKNGVYHCSVDGCGEVFPTYNSFLRHGQEKHEITRYLCNICGKKFLMNSRLKSHQEWVHGIGEKMECTVCHKILNGANTLRSHMLSHNSEEFKYNCEICGKLYRYRSSLIQHKNTSHQVKEMKKFTCEVCGMIYTKKVSLTHHIVMTNHIGENQQFALRKAKKCDQCGKLFGTNVKLKTHIAQVHIKVKSHVCTYCGKSFGDISTLRQHIQIHTGDRPMCNICNLPFRSQRKLCQHMLDTHGMQTEYSKFDPLKYQLSQESNSDNAISAV